MNQLAGLGNVKFNELTKNQLIDVLNFYCDENKYFNLLIDEEDNLNTKNDVLEYFENRINPICEIKEFFKNWTK